jgi:hypothetical protein
MTILQGYKVVRIWFPADTKIGHADEYDGVTLPFSWDTLTSTFDRRYRCPETLASTIELRCRSPIPSVPTAATLSVLENTGYAVTTPSILVMSGCDDTVSADTVEQHKTWAP